MKGMDCPEIAYHVMRGFVNGDIPDKELRRITADAFNFEIPIENVTDNRFVMRLDRGPTASFKDFAARTMARQMQYFIRETNKKMTILVATSGDTGGAVANAFHNLENINVVVLFPETEVTERQRRQMTTLGGNVSACAVEGKFDDCQYLVKTAFSDPDLVDLNLSSANSINIGRLLPQMVYYFYAHSLLALDEGDIGFSVPSGNFGNGTAAILAKRVGLPIDKLILGVNGNDEFSVFLSTGTYEQISPSINCISNAMNVGHPSNLARIFYLYGGDMDEKGGVKRMPTTNWMHDELYSTSVSEFATVMAMRDVYGAYNVLLEPHGAVAWDAMDCYLAMNDTYNVPYVSLETAHPAKFAETIRKELGIAPEVPESLSRLDGLKESYSLISRSSSGLKEMLRDVIK